MATFSLNTSLSNLLFSSQLPGEIKFNTDVSSVLFVIKDAITNTEIFSVTLDSNNRIICLYDLKSVLEQYMRDQGLSYVRIWITAYQDDVNGVELLKHLYSIIYCSAYYSGDAEEFVSKNFLTTLSAKTTHKSVAERLAFFVGNGSSVTEKFKIVVSDNGNERVIDKSQTSAIAANEMVQTRIYSYDYIMGLTGLNATTTRIKAFTVSVDSRSFTFYYRDRLPNVVFGFRNVFNSFEMAVMNAITSGVTKVDRSIATCNGIKTFYDQSVLKNHEVETAGLSKPMADWIDQLVYSHDVRFYNKDKVNVDEWDKVLITESTCEIDDSDDSLNSIKFKWQFETSMPSLVPVEELGIFTYEFDNAYT